MSRKFFIKNWSPFHAIALGVVLFFGIVFFPTIIAFQVPCQDYGPMPALCWENKPIWVHGGWVLPVCLGIVAFILVRIIKRQ